MRQRGGLESWSTWREKCSYPVGQRGEFGFVPTELTLHRPYDIPQFVYVLPCEAEGLTHHSVKGARKIVLAHRPYDPGSFEQYVHTVDLSHFSWRLGVRGVLSWGWEKIPDAARKV